MGSKAKSILAILWKSNLSETRPVNFSRLILPLAKLGLDHWLHLVQVFRAKEGCLDDLVFAKEHKREAFTDQVQDGEPVELGHEANE